MKHLLQGLNITLISLSDRNIVFKKLSAVMNSEIVLCFTNCWA